MGAGDPIEEAAMRTRLTGPAAGLACMLAAVAAKADDAITGQTTADLRAACIATGDAERHLCYGFIMGAGQLYAELVRAEVIPELVCPDPVPNLDTIRTAFVDWADARPERGGTRAIDGLMEAAATAWPCE